MLEQQSSITSKLHFDFISYSVCREFNAVLIVLDAMLKSITLLVVSAVHENKGIQNILSNQNSCYVCGPRSWSSDSRLNFVASRLNFVAKLILSLTRLPSRKTRWRLNLLPTVHVASRRFNWFIHFEAMPRRKVRVLCIHCLSCNKLKISKFAIRNVTD